MWPNESIDFVRLPEDEHGIHFGLFLENELISIVSLFEKGKSVQFRKFATVISEQGKGYGTMLLSHVMEEAASSQMDSIWCNARVGKLKYYEKFGLIKTDQYFMKKEINYVIMKKKLIERY